MEKAKNQELVTLDQLFGESLADSKNFGMNSLSHWLFDKINNNLYNKDNKGDLFNLTEDIKDEKGNFDRVMMIRSTDVADDKVLVFSIKLASKKH